MTAEDAIALACVVGEPNKAASVIRCRELCGHGPDHERLWLARYGRLAGIGYIDPRYWILTPPGVAVLKSHTSKMYDHYLVCQKALQ